MESVAQWLEWLASWMEPGTPLRLDLLGRLLLATLLGGAIGWERERKAKAAGLRTNILICVGATLITDLSIMFQGMGGTADPARIAAQIVSGIGFLGAGTIIQARGSISGLTTAATLWVVAAIGMTVGGRAYIEATGATLLVLLVLIPLSRLETHQERRARPRSVKVSITGSDLEVQEVLDRVEAGSLAAWVRAVETDLSANSVRLSLETSGDAASFETLRRVLASPANMVVPPS